MALQKIRHAALVACASVVLLSAQASAQATATQIQAGFRPDPGVLSGTAGGLVDGSRIGNGCTGFYPAQAQHQLVVRSPLPFLQIFTNAAENADVTLAIVGPTGVRCDDDSGGDYQAKLIGPIGAGTYQIFVGSYQASAHPTYQLVYATSASVDRSNYRSQVTTGTNVVIQHNGTLNPNGNSPWNNGNGNTTPPPAERRIDQLARLRPTVSSLRISVGRGHTVRNRGRTGGVLQAAEVHDHCVGFIFEAPTYNVVLDRMAPMLRFTVGSAADTTLMVRGPDGTVSCNDDMDGAANRNPLVRFANAAPGTYAVWVGIYRSGSRNVYQLTATTNDAMVIQ
jgi:hypothetical protein